MVNHVLGVSPVDGELYMDRFVGSEFVRIKIHALTFSCRRGGRVAVAFDLRATSGEDIV